LRGDVVTRQNNLQELGQRLRSARKERGLTLRELSDRCGLSVSFISQIEKGSTSVTITSLEKIANALGISMESLFKVPKEGKSIVRANERQGFQIDNRDIIYYRLSDDSLEKKNLEVFVVHLLPSARWTKTLPYTHVGEEFGFVLDGVLSMVFQGQETDLYPGDSIHIKSTIPHNWLNKTDKVVSALWVFTPTIS
jgi:transcriptional regulator with XRE-family HTH domain